MDIIKVKESRRYIKTISKEHVNTLLIVGYSIDHVEGTLTNG